MEQDSSMNQDLIPRNPAGYPEEETLDIKQLFYRVIANWYWYAISVFIALLWLFG